MQEFFSSAAGDPYALEPIVAAEVPESEVLKTTRTGEVKVDWDKVIDVAQFATSFISKLPARQRTEVDNAIRSACGKKPLIGKDKKERYEACAKRVIDAYMSQFKAAPSSSGGTQVIYRDRDRKKTNLTPLWIGLGVVAVAGLAFYLYRRSRA